MTSRTWLAAALAVGLVFGGCSADRSSATGAPPLPAGLEFSGQRAFAYIERQCDFGPRDPGSAGHAACLQWLRKELAATADRVFTQSFEKTHGGKTRTFTNVFAAYGNVSSNPILLCAHWDTRPFADQEIEPERAKRPIPGANDGASGVALLLEIGRLLKKQKPAAGVVIALFDGEDFGRSAEDMFIGSTEFANRYKTVMWGVTTSFRYGILLDMVGATDMQIPREPNSERAAPELMRRIWETARAAGHARFFPDRIGPAVTDDHIPLIEKGIPTVDLIAFDYPYWHTLEDTPDKCSPKSLQAVGDVVTRVVYSEKAAR